jgi:DNA-binding HxlR family transcriptional regulator
MMAALDLLGQRWTLRVIWELQQEQSLGFRELRRRADEMSSSVLANRLRRLTEAGIITAGEDGSYRLTDLGDALGPALEPLRAWAGRWAAEMPDSAARSLTENGRVPQTTWSRWWWTSGKASTDRVMKQL